MEIMKTGQSRTALLEELERAVQRFRERLARHELPTFEEYSAISDLYLFRAFDELAQERRLRSAIGFGRVLAEQAASMLALKTQKALSS
jgi:hypothetical protein